MLKGRYQKRVDYTHLHASLFNPALYCPTIYGKAGCGATALSLITGEHPFDARDLNKRCNHYPDRFMLKYLKDRSYTVIPITERGVTSCDSDNYPITSSHIILASQLMIKHEASWVVYHRNIGYHNFIPGNIMSLDFINKPILTAYIIYHPRFDATRRKALIKSKNKV